VDDSRFNALMVCGCSHSDLRLGFSREIVENMNAIFPQKLFHVIRVFALIAVAWGIAACSQGGQTTRDERSRALWHDLRPKLGKNVPDGEPSRLIRHEGKHLTAVAFGFSDVDPYINWCVVYLENEAKTVVAPCTILECRVIDEAPSFFETATGRILFTAEEESRGTGLHFINFEVFIGPTRALNETTYSPSKMVFYGHSEGYALVPLNYSRRMAEFYFGSARPLKHFPKGEWPLWAYDFNYLVTMSDDVLHINRNGTIHLRKADDGRDLNPKDLSNRSISEIYQFHVDEGLFEPGF